VRVSLRHHQHHLSLDVHPEGGKYRVSVDGTDHLAEAHYLDDATLVLTVDGRRYRVDLARIGAERLVAVDGEVYRFVPESAVGSSDIAALAPPEIVAPMPGKVLQVLVQPGDQVAAGDGLLILEAMKMENRLLAEAAATVREVRIAQGDMVEGGQVLVVLAYNAG
jgi:3-methylcrotonyl-CoA carboxylase alpha subunit